MIKVLTKMPYARARVHIHPDRIGLQSYETMVATIDYGWLHINGLYSATTRKHISAFCKEYANIDDFKVIKMLYTQGYDLNIHTGEIVKSECR